MSSQPPDAADLLRNLRPLMPSTFWSFHARYDRAFLEYSRIHLGSATAARRLVNGTFLLLATVWPRLEHEPDAGARVWAMFKERVHGELAAQGRSPDVRETMAFARAIRAAAEPLLRSFRDSFQAEHGHEIGELEEGLGLYRAMTRLSERQFDIIVLRDALDFSTRDTALIVGISEATVRSVRRTARHRLAAAMGYSTAGISDNDQE
ncbi:sigma-70 family RNA polymerase sigma factor (plasmid) [Streptomyces enissocaesilis]|uniref:RNA polymerase sigma factor n=1 Tax=Streptomyces TaxID=1883 RepID=UPI00163C5D19|nr:MULTISPECIES: sigma-70 family RNA polymerase sigma factor [Streptomyces]WDI23378.1 sigma-70 family RNA polymerase sigma factor [Streptomyces enissocaesilis]WMI61957.1 sigma-70 family RNA polymerase sigma factor [Streptomyces rochei]